MWKKYNSKKEDFFIIDHNDRSCPRMLFVCMHVWLFPFNTVYQYLYPRFRLAFSPALYKFIVRAFWVWVHSCSGFKSKLVLIGSFGKLQRRRFFVTRETENFREQLTFEEGPYIAFKSRDTIIQNMNSKNS